MSTAADPATLSDSDRLIAALQMCFGDLGKKQEEQGEKLYRAVEALKPQVPPTDNKTAFWISYMKLADEHDKEFQEKYSTDLDTALIFSGLFSAVASAFVIQIEPQLVMDPRKVIVIVQCLLYASLFTTLLAALLAVLGKQWLMYYQAAGSRGTIEERGLERQRKLDGLVKWKFEAVLQAFPLLLQLALLLFASSISLYLWTIHHSVAILVTALTALGLGSYIFLLAAATIFSDCPFQTPLGTLLRQAPGIFLNTAKTIRRTSQPVLRSLRTAISKPLGTIFRVTALQAIFTQLRDTTRRFWPLVSRFGSSKFDLLPRFMSRVLPSAKEPDPYARYKYIQASSEVPAVLWALNTSTDPAIIGAAVELGADLQWPIELDRSVQTIAQHLWITAQDLCVDNSSRTVRPGMLHSAVMYGKLYCTFSLHVQPRYSIPDMISMTIGASNAADEPTAILQFWIDGDEAQIKLPGNSAVVVQWVLHIIPSLDIPPKDKIRYLARNFLSEAPANMQIFTNFLCCVSATSGPIEPWLMRTVDKSDLCYLLMNRFFIALGDLAATDKEVTVKLLDIATQLAVAVELAPRFDERDTLSNLVREMSNFCNKFPRAEGWLEVMVMAGGFGRTGLAELKIIHQRTRFGIGNTLNPPLPRFDIREIAWIYMALEHVQKSWQEDLDIEDGVWNSDTTRAIDGLLQVLSCNESLPDTPPVSSLQIILRALSSTADVAATAFLVLARAKLWFLNPDLQSVMLQFSVWHHMGRVARYYKRKNRVWEDVITDSYQELVQHVASQPEWKSALFDELPTCIAVFSDPSGPRRWIKEPQTSNFVFILQNIWVPQFAKIDGNQLQIQFTDAGQQCTALCLVALSDVWESYDVSKSSLEQFLQLVRCTVSTALLTWNRILSPLEDLEPVFTSRLCGALTQAAVNARQSTQVGVLGSLDANPSNVEIHPARRMTELLEMLSHKLEIEFNRPDHKRDTPLQDRNALRNELETEIDLWEKSLETPQEVEEEIAAAGLAARVDSQDTGEGVGGGIGA
ncbi:hypothetical protein B0H16DRAFT_1881938 [Mycena metata]|uniref:DUF6535 domain-containing protein n=1 Tax=Mycena metata TaxID=1033252 RepID=A0AAD7NP83_9AGAR|nr:hypothetical protein B0H16DRAFT_1881938 [Mycena metata]